MTKQKIIKLFFSLLKNILWMIPLVLILSLYQTRNLPSGKDLTCLQNIKKPALIYAWAPWCGVCQFSAPGLQQFMNEHSNFTFMPVAFDGEDTKSYDAFIENVGFAKEKVVIGDEALRNCLKVEAYPTYFVLSKSGEKVFPSVGFTPKWTLALRFWLAEYF